jgi:hypothetical protein
VNILITDPIGKRTGFDPNNGLINEIDWSTYTGPNTDAQVINIPNQATGEYVVTVFGIDDGNYSINVMGVLADGIMASSQWINGTITKGQMLVAFVNDSQVSYAVGVSPLKSVFGQGYNVPVNLTIFNTGSSTENFNVMLCVNSTTVDTELILALLNGTSATIACTWNTTSSAYGNYTLSAYTYAAGNNYTCSFPVHVGVPGDISGPTQGVYDGTCNMRDIQYLIAYFNTRPSSPNWKPNADINNDGTVNMRDIQIAILDFNKHE